MTLALSGCVYQGSEEHMFPENFFHAIKLLKVCISNKESLELM